VDVLLPPIANPHFLDIVSQPIFTPEECERIVASCGPDRWGSALVEQARGDQSYGALKPEERSVTQQLLPVDDSGWPLTTIVRAIEGINDAIYRYRLWRLPPTDVPNVLRYETATNDHFRPHMDTGQANATRKLSYTVQLSPPTAYTGCDLVFTNNATQGSRQQGVLTVFPSIHWHTVTPVYSGVRYAIVGWVHGPTFC
jgi:hypothetical protein